MSKKFLVRGARTSDATVNEHASAWPSRWPPRWTISSSGSDVKKLSGRSSVRDRDRETLAPQL